jgi:hypothetical protein
MLNIERGQESVDRVVELDLVTVVTVWLCLQYGDFTHMK